MLHAVAAALSLFGVAALLMQARSPLGRAAALVYGFSLFALFFVSAVYHRTAWTRRGRRVARAFDHSAIFVFIAGSATPLCLLVERGSRVMLTLTWVGALLGVLKATLWPRAPKRIAVAMYLGLGWLAASLFPRLVPVLGAGRVLLLVLVGVAYTAGAVVYARRRPNPAPRVFGYHEVFHALTVAAAAAHFIVAAAAIAQLG